MSSPQLVYNRTGFLIHSLLYLARLLSLADCSIFSSGDLNGRPHHPETGRIRIEAGKSVPSHLLLDCQVREVVLERAQLSIRFYLLRWPRLLQLRFRLGYVVDRTNVSIILLGGLSMLFMGVFVGLDCGKPDLRL